MLFLLGLARIFTSPEIHQESTTKSTTFLAKPFLPGIHDHFSHPKIHRTSNPVFTSVFDLNMRHPHNSARIQPKMQHCILPVLACSDPRSSPTHHLVLAGILAALAVVQTLGRFRGTHQPVAGQAAASWC